MSNVNRFSFNKSEEQVIAGYINVSIPTASGDKKVGTLRLYEGTPIHDAMLKILNDSEEKSEELLAKLQVEYRANTANEAISIL